jgi:hypothetical protein
MTKITRRVVNYSKFVNTSPGKETVFLVFPHSLWSEVKQKKNAMDIKFLKSTEGKNKKG